MSITLDLNCRKPLRINFSGCRGARRARNCTGLHPGGTPRSDMREQWGFCVRYAHQGVATYFQDADDIAQRGANPPIFGTASGGQRR
eukprot:15246405-Alexandrium_andersonii.AAC.1